MIYDLSLSLLKLLMELSKEREFNGKNIVPTGRLVKDSSRQSSKNMLIVHFRLEVGALSP